MGKAVEWQATVTKALEDLEVLICNPRRVTWDASWINSYESEHFRLQVEWELDAMEKADLILFYFAPDTKAPITLLELGLHARGKGIVCCPEGYWRKGNVDVVCRRYGIPQVDTLDELIARARKELRQRSCIEKS